ncbi:MAG TPA: hypothetical protein VFK05_03310 [Polyangiaceae bacterium]|nr:hypothetical protein [Polyangiaceae bacterium]
MVLALLSTAILAERSAMGERRTRAEQAFRRARKCALACLERHSPSPVESRRQCSEAAHSAAEASWELPERNAQQLELQAALDELARALEGEDEQRLSSALARSSRAGNALGWRNTDTSAR